MRANATSKPVANSGHLYQNFILPLVTISPGFALDEYGKFDDGIELACDHTSLESTWIVEVNASWESPKSVLVYLRPMINLATFVKRSNAIFYDSFSIFILVMGVVDDPLYLINTYTSSFDVFVLSSTAPSAVLIGNTITPPLLLAPVPLFP